MWQSHGRNYRGSVAIDVAFHGNNSISFPKQQKIQYAHEDFCETHNTVFKPNQINFDQGWHILILQQIHVKQIFSEFQI